MSAEGEVDWDAHVDARKGFRPQSHWERWPKSLKRRFNRIAGDALVRVGYEPNGDWY